MRYLGLTVISGVALALSGVVAPVSAEEAPQDPLTTQRLLESQDPEMTPQELLQGQIFLGRQIGPADPSVDRAVPGIGAIDSSVVGALTHDDESLAGPIPQQVLLDIIFLLNVDLMSRLPDDYASQTPDDQYKLQIDILTEGGYPQQLLGMSREDIVDRSYFSQLLEALLRGQINCEATLRTMGIITQPEGVEVTLTGQELTTCYTHEGIMSASTPTITGLEIRDILTNPGLDWRRALDPGASDILAPFENSLEGVFVTPLSPSLPLQQDQI